MQTYARLLNPGQRIGHTLKDTLGYVHPVRGTPEGWDVVYVDSSSPGKKWKVDITFGRCDCPHWVNQKVPKRPCKHLKRLGFIPVQLAA